jgi:uncharacterized membrane protein YfcA
MAATPVAQGTREPLLTPKLALVGAVGGVTSGLLGVGGGILIVPLLVLWAGYSQRDAHAWSLGAIVPIAIAGLITYGAAGEVRSRRRSRSPRARSSAPRSGRARSRGCPRSS